MNSTQARPTHFNTETLNSAQGPSYIYQKQTRIELWVMGLNDQYHIFTLKTCSPTVTTRNIIIKFVAVFRKHAIVIA